MSLALRQHAGWPVSIAMVGISSIRTCGRKALYTRIQHTIRHANTKHLSSYPTITTSKLHLYPPTSIRSPLSQSLIRTFTTQHILLAAEQKSQQTEEQTRDEQNPRSEEEETSSNKGKSDKKAKADESPPPPPPHGDKSPWQVFTETLSKEFEASKEWNDSTKQLSDSAHGFQESESVKRARAAYSAASEAASSKTSAAFKSTGKVIGQSATWTWDTSVMKGVRKSASAAGRGIDAATKPIRETEAFKSVKDVIDDGSSSRYGGWTEKEERRRVRELRERAEIQSGKRFEKMEEDPKYLVNFICL